MWKSASVLAFAFTLSLPANAALIDNGSYLTDTVSGLDWLKLSQTIDRSYDDVSSQLGMGGEFVGWQYASGAQFESLLINQGVETDAGCSDNTNFCGGAHVTNYPIINNLVNVIGDTFEHSVDGGLLTSQAKASLGILSDSDLNSSAHYVGLLVGSYLTDTPYARTHYGNLQGNAVAEGHIGSFLVRPSEVPAPAAGFLFISALVGLMGRQRFSKAN